MADIPVDTLPMQEYRAAREEGKGAGDSVSTAELEQKEAEQPTGREKTLNEYKEKREKSSRGGFQARVGRLIKERAIAQQENQTLKERLAQLEGKNGNGNGQESSSDADRADGQETREETSSSRAADDPRAVRAREKFKDFDAVMRSASNVRIADEASRELHESPLAGHVSYFIAKNPDLASELAKLPPAQQVQEIRRMEENFADSEPGASALVERLVGNSTPDEIKDLHESSRGNPHLLRAIFHHMQELADLSNGRDVYIALAKDPDLSRHIASLPKSKAALALGRISASLEREERPRTQVPAPIRPVSGGATRSTVDLSTASYQDFKRLREQGRVR